MKSPLLTKELAALSSVYLSRCVDEGGKIEARAIKTLELDGFFYISS